MQMTRYDDETLKQIRRNILNLSFMAGDGNLQSCFSCVEILYVLYEFILNNEDCFVLSKGQSCFALYSVLAYKNIIKDKRYLHSTICKFDSKYGMQVDVTKLNGEISVSTGSLGHGLPMSVGIAMANKIKNFKNRVYCLCGDGEFLEGTMWESCLLATTHKLDNLCVIVDYNHSVFKMVNVISLRNKLESFGFYVIECNGHDVKDIRSSLRFMFFNMPVAVICNTERGYGSKTLMDDNSWFHRSPNSTELKILKKEVDEF
jgi:transketolase